MIIERIPVARLNPDPYSLRVDLQPGDPDYDKLLRSIGEFGLVEPLVWNRRGGHLVGGHQRLKVLLARGETHVQVSVVAEMHGAVEVDVPPRRPSAGKRERFGFMDPLVLRTDLEVQVPVPTLLLERQIAVVDPVREPVLSEVLLVIGASVRHSVPAAAGREHLQEYFDAQDGKVRHVHS